MKKIFFLITFSFSSIILFAQNVGIGTLIPKARLHVTDSSVAFSATAAASATPGNPPISGAGRRMMWYADKGAFRAGHVVNQEWDKNNIGNYSFAVGSGTQASGLHSVAMGYGSLATSNESFAVGNGAQASGFNTIAMGLSSIASGGGATAIGYNNSSTGSYAVSIGAVNNATGTSATAMGSFSTASADYSSAFGRYLKSKSFGGFATGLFNDTIYTASATAIANSNRIFEIGNGTSNSIRSNAITVLQNGNTGIGTVSPAARLHVIDSSVVFSASDIASFSPNDPPISGEGRRMMWYADKAAFRAGYVITNRWDKDSIGKYSFAAGYNTKAKGIYSTAWGNNTEATGDKASTWGNFTDATGENATAWGNSTNAFGNNATAWGSFTTATGENATAMGRTTTARGFSSLVIGLYNDPVLINPETDITPNTPLFIVGNGSFFISSNALLVRKDGNVGIGTSTPNTLIDIKGDVAYSKNTVNVLNGMNNDINPGRYSFISIDGPTAAFSLSGFTGGVDGKILTVLNLTGQNMTIVSQTSSTSSAVNRINTLSGTDIVTIGNGSVTMQYSSADDRWMVIAVRE
jgi:hypothetical protein